jgi:hypothetical protein
MNCSEVNCQFRESWLLIEALHVESMQGKRWIHQVSIIEK